MTVFDADLVVIGSGFGGSVAALRASEAGMRVLVVEEGRRLSPRDLQRGAERTRSLLWEPGLGLTGYFRQTVLRDVVVVSGVGVGGGSIVYAAVLLRPDDEAFTADGWARTGIDWAHELRPHFEVASAKLGRELNPRHGLQDEWLRQSAEALGVSDSFGPTPQGIDFSTCVGCAQCITGCPRGAKNSLDRTYLAEAEGLGAAIRPRARAEIVIPLDPGGLGNVSASGEHGWRVVLRDPLARGHRTGVTSVTARQVVLAAGVLGTTRLLLANRDRWRTLPRLSVAVGRHVRTNSEAFAAVLHPRGTDILDGSTISSHYYPDSITHVTNNRFPKSYRFMKWYLSPAVSSQDQVVRRMATLWCMASRPLSATANLRASSWNRRVTVLTVMQSADNELQLVYRRRPWGWSLGSDAGADGAPIPAHLPQADAAGAALAKVSGGTAFGTVMDSIFGISATAHVLGGAPIGPDPDRGVIDAEHRVFGYEGLRVMDGSAVPANVGVNPALTITAMAERAMARWLRSS